MATVLARHLSTASPTALREAKYFLIRAAAEFRGPGVRHQFDHDSPDDYEVDLDHRSAALTGGFGRGGRIILLGDGTEVLTDSDDAEMFDQSEEQMDTENQVKKDTPDTSSDLDSARSEREGTPAPRPAADEPTGASTVKDIAGDANPKKDA